MELDYNTKRSIKMKSINREAMFNVLTKVLNTDTIILHYKELDTALKAYYFFRDEFYAKSKKASVISEDEEDYWTKSPSFREGRISLVEYPEHSQYCVFISICSPYLGYTTLSDKLLADREITPIRISRPLKSDEIDSYLDLDYFTNPIDVKFPRGLALEKIVTLEDSLADKGVQNENRPN